MYACERFFRECKEKKWKYILRFKEGSIPYIAEEYQSLRKREKNLREEKEFRFLTNLPVSQKNVETVVQQGRMRWKIENEGFNTKKRKSYHLEHQYSKNYEAQKCHYYLIQIGHMISQVLEAWGKL